MHFIGAKNTWSTTFFIAVAVFAWLSGERLSQLGTAGFGNFPTVPAIIFLVGFLYFWGFAHHFGPFVATSALTDKNQWIAYVALGTPIVLALFSGALLIWRPSGSEIFKGRIWVFLPIFALLIVMIYSFHINFHKNAYFEINLFGVDRKFIWQGLMISVLAWISYFVPDGTPTPKPEETTIQLNVFASGRATIDQVFVKGEPFP